MFFQRAVLLTIQVLWNYVSLINKYLKLGLDFLMLIETRVFFLFHLSQSVATPLTSSSKTPCSFPKDENWCVLNLSYRLILPSTWEQEWCSSEGLHPTLLCPGFDSWTKWVQCCVGYNPLQGDFLMSLSLHENHRPK